MANLSNLEQASKDHFADTATVIKASSDPWCLPGYYNVKFKGVFDGLDQVTESKNGLQIGAGLYHIKCRALVEGTDVSIPNQKFYTASVPDHVYNERDKYESFYLDVVRKGFTLWANYLQAHSFDAVGASGIPSIVDHMETVGCTWNVRLMGMKGDERKFIDNEEDATEALSLGYALKNYLDKKPGSVKPLES